MSVGEVLAKARRDRGLSIEDVSSATRIRGTVIRGIENDDYSLCGGHVYARGHIRSIAHVVGVDSAPLIADYDGEFGSAPAVSAAPTGGSFDPEAAARAERRGTPNWAAAMAAALVIVIAIAAYGLVAGHKKSPSATAGSPPANSASPSPRATPTAPATTAPPLALTKGSGVTVLLRVITAQTWTSVQSASGATLFQGLLGIGSQKIFKDPKQVRLVIGNAPAVDLVVNGKELGSPKSQGSVARLTFGPGDPTGTASG